MHFYENENFDEEELDRLLYKKRKGDFLSTKLLPVLIILLTGCAAYFIFICKTV